MKKKQILLSLVLWLAFNGFAALLRFGSQTMGLFPHPAVNTVTAILLPVGAGLLFSRWLPLKTSFLFAAMSVTSLLFSMWLAAVWLLVNGLVAYWLAGELLAGRTLKN
ncbi:MAG: hypothetical protein R6X34_06095 [Chloroflexota bacterium]